MPNAVVKSYAKKSGKSAEHIEGYWKEAEAEAKKKFKKKGPKFWAYVNAIVKRRSGVSESISFSEFCNMMLDEARQWNPIDYGKFIEYVQAEQPNGEAVHDDGLVIVYVDNKRVGEFKYEGDTPMDKTRGEYWLTYDDD